MEIVEHCSKEEVTQKELFYLDSLKPTYNILKFAGSSLGFKHYYSTIVQMKERNKNNHPFLGRKHSKESKSKMSLFSFRSLPFKILDIERGKEKLLMYKLLIFLILVNKLFIKRVKLF